MMDGRGAVRRRVLKSGKIVTSGKAPPIPCTVRNLSETGALVAVGSSTIGIPGEFGLVIGNGPQRLCRVVWRTLDAMGLLFL